MTSPLAGPPPSPPSSAEPAGSPPQSPLPAAQRGSRRALVVGIIAVFVLLAAGGAATVWWLARGGDKADSPMAGRPRVTDARAGLTYAIPAGWANRKGDLIAAFTSSIAAKRAHGEEGGAVVLAGRARPLPQSALKRQTEIAARSNAEFFYPDQSVGLEESRATKVSGRPAHTVVLKVHDAKGGTGHLRLTLIAADDRHAAFLLGIAQPAGAAERNEVDAVLESATLK